jgi:hypothetical protein
MRKKSGKKRNNENYRITFYLKKAVAFLVNNHIITFNYVCVKYTFCAHNSTSKKRDDFSKYNRIDDLVKDKKLCNGI